MPTTSSATPPDVRAARHQRPHHQRPSHPGHLPRRPAPRAGAPEIGYAPLTLTAEAHSTPLHQLDGVPVLHWHGDHFYLPADAVRLASTPRCGNQAFAVGNHLLALQFHLETAHQELERWLVGHAESLAALHIHPDTLRRAAAEAAPLLHQAATRVQRLAAGLLR